MKADPVAIAVHVPVVVGVTNAPAPLAAVVAPAPLTDPVHPYHSY